MYIRIASNYSHFADTELIAFAFFLSLASPSWSSREKKWSKENSGELKTIPFQHGLKMRAKKEEIKRTKDMSSTTNCVNPQIELDEHSIVHINCEM